jgi:uncharacterized DUF497 family protein
MDEKTGALSANVLKAFVRAALDKGGTIIRIGSHCRANMAKRGFDVNDVLAVLRIDDYSSSVATWQEDRKSWSYAITGRDGNGKRLKIIFSLEGPCCDRLRIISGEYHYKGRKV